MTVDGGYGWVIVAICFLTTAFADSFIFTYGALYSDLIDLYDESISNVMIGGFLMLGFSNAVGPVGAALINKYGFRFVMVFGSVTSTIAISGSSFVDSILWFNILMGFIGGTTQGIVLLGAYTMSPLWFEKKRSIACAIASSGIGFGCVVYPLVIDWLISIYSIRGCILIIGGINLNLLVFSLMVKEPHSLGTIETLIVQDLKNKSSRTFSQHFAQENFNKSLMSLRSQITDGDIKQFEEDLVKEITKPFQKSNLSIFNSQRCESNDLPHEHELCDVYVTKRDVPTQFFGCILRIFQPELFKNIPFWIILCSTFLLTIILFAIPQTMRNYVDVIGFSRDQSSSFSIIYGAITVISKIAVGVTVRYMKQSKLVYAISGIILAISTALIGFIPNFPYIIYYSVILAIASSHIIIMRYVITAEYIPKKYLTSAYGWTFLIMSTALIPALFIAEIGTDHGDYILSFVVNGILVLLGSIVIFFLYLMESDQ